MKNMLSLLILLTWSTGTFAASPFVFTAIPDQDETKLQERFQKVADYLAKTLEQDVKYVPVKSYAAAVTAFRNNQVQLAWFGGLSGVRARLLVPGSEAIAQGSDDNEFKTYIIANTGTGIKGASDLPETLRGRSFTFGSKGSTSGRLMPEYFIRETFKESPDAVFSRVGFSGNHSRTIALVASGAYEAGAVNYQVWESELAAGKFSADDVEIVWETPSYPDYHWTIRGDVDETYGAGFKSRVTEALIAIKEDALLEVLGRKGFIPAQNADYKSIETVGKSIGLLD